MAVKSAKSRERVARNFIKSYGRVGFRKLLESLAAGESGQTIANEFGVSRERASDSGRTPSAKSSPTTASTPRSTGSCGNVVQPEHRALYATGVASAPRENGRPNPSSDWMEPDFMHLLA